MRRTAGVLLAALALGAVSFDPGASASGAPAARTDLEALASDDAEVREARIAELAAEGESSAPGLVLALEVEPSALVKAGVAEALARMDLSEEEEIALGSLLRAADPVTRIEGARLVGRKNPGALEKDLVAVLTDAREVVAVRAAAAVALGRAGAGARDALAKAADDPQAPMPVRRAAVRGLALTGEEGAKDAHGLAISAQTPAPLVEAALEALADPETPGQAQVLDLAESSAATTRAWAAGALLVRGARGEEVEASLVVLLSDEDAAVRVAAVGALAGLEALADHGAEVLGLLEDKDPGVLVVAAQALGALGEKAPQGAADAIAALLSSEESGVRLSAALALLALGDLRGEAAMAADALSEDESVAGAAQAAMAVIEEAAAGATAADEAAGE